MKLKLDLLVFKDIVSVLRDGVGFWLLNFCLLKVWSLVIHVGKTDVPAESCWSILSIVESNGLNEQQKELLSHG